MRKGKKLVPGVVVPEAPAPVKDMAPVSAAFNEKRAAAFPRWKAAVEAAGGNITHLGEAEFPDQETKSATNRAYNQVRRLGLLKYAAELRAQATGNPGPGRPAVKAVKK